MKYSYDSGESEDCIVPIDWKYAQFIVIAGCQ